MEKDKYAPQKKYREKNETQLRVWLNRNTDADILEWLGSQSNKAAAVKDALRKVMKSEE